MKTGAEVVVYNDEDFLGAALKALEPLDRVVVLVGKKPWCGKPWPNDRSLEIARSFETKHPRKYTVIEGEWTTEAEERNFGLDRLKDCPIAMIVDADEVWEQSHLLNYLVEIERTFDQYAAWHALAYQYWKSPDWVVLPDTHWFLQALRPDRTRFSQLRGVTNGPLAYVSGPRFHHFSYVRKSDERIRQKIESFSHAHEIVPGWYENVWLKWTPDMENLHPTQPPGYKKAIAHRCPQEILDLIRAQY